MTHTNPELGTSRGTRPTSKKPTGRIVATTGTAALALAGITATTQAPRPRRRSCTGRRTSPPSTTTTATSTA